MKTNFTTTVMKKDLHTIGHGGHFVSQLPTLSKAERGRPEGPTEQSVFKFFFGILANFRANISEAQGDFLVFKIDAATKSRLQITQPIFDLEPRW